MTRVTKEGECTTTALPAMRERTWKRRRQGLVDQIQIKLCSDFAVRFGETTWARACGRTSRLNHMLRYGRPDEIVKERLVIADILSCYNALVYADAQRRNEVVAHLRAAEELAAPEEMADA